MDDRQHLEEEPTNAAADDGQDLGPEPSARDLKFGQYKFMFVLVLIALLLMALSPIFNRYLEAYQGVVVAPVQDGEVKILTHEGMPETKSISDETAQRLEVGTYLRKDEFTWDPQPIPESELSDIASIQDPARQPPLLLPQLYARYTAEWEGTVTGVQERRLPTTGDMGERRFEYVMTVELKDGGTREMKVPDDLVGEVHEGTRLVKKSQSWIPVAINR